LVAAAGGERAVGEQAIDRLLDALRDRGSRVRQSRDGYSAQCPAHEDRTPSLALRQVEGQTLVCCHAGCRTEDVVSALGLTMADLFDDRAGARYQYRDHSGAPTRVVHRTPHKQFRQSGNLSTMQLYRLPEVVAAVAAGRTVYLVEGEKDVHTLESLGQVATTGPQGADSFGKVDVSPLKGATVLAIADSDAQGEKWAALVADRLTGYAGSLRVMRAKAGKDVTDHVMLGHDLGDLVAVDPKPWDEPLPLGWSASLPGFPVDALPPVLSRYIVAKSAEVQTPTDLFAAPVLGVVAAAIGGRVRVELRPGYEEPTNLFVVPVAPPSSRKSAAVIASRAPLDEAEQLVRAERAPGILDATVRYQVLSKRASTAREAAEKAGTDEALAEAQAAARDAADAEPEQAPRLVIGDTTPEKLVSLLCTHGRLACISDEAGMLDSLVGRHSKKSNLDPLLKAYTGARIDSETHIRGSERSDRPALTLVMSIQPFALEQIVRGGETAGRGLTTRMLWALVPDIAGTRWWANSVPAPEAVTTAYRTLVVNVATYMAMVNEEITLHLDERAAKLIGEFHDRVERLMTPGEEYGAGLIKEWAGKLTGTVGRIAAGLHVIANPPTLSRGAFGGITPEHWAPGEVDEAAMVTAIRIGDYFLAHAAAVFGGEAPHAKSGRELLTWLLSRDLVTFKIRDVLRKGPSHLRKADALAPVLAHLTQLGWIKQTPDGAYVMHPNAKSAATAATRATDGPEGHVSAGQGDSTTSARWSRPPATPATGRPAAKLPADRLSQPSRSPATSNPAPREAAASANAGVSHVSHVSQPVSATDDDEVIDL
jgi:putative DNA primase/helicase